MTYIPALCDWFLISTCLYIPSLPFGPPAGLSFFFFFSITVSLISPLGLCTYCSICLKFSSLDLISSINHIVSQMPGA